MTRTRAWRSTRCRARRAPQEASAFASFPSYGQGLLLRSTLSGRLGPSQAESLGVLVRIPSDWALAACQCPNPPRSPDIFRHLAVETFANLNRELGLASHKPTVHRSDEHPASQSGGRR